MTCLLPAGGWLARGYTTPTYLKTGKSMLHGPQSASGMAYIPILFRTTRSLGPVDYTGRLCDLGVVT